MSNYILCKAINSTLFLLLSACVSPREKVFGQAKSAWDFDHQVQFKKIMFDNNHYQLEIITNNRVKFQQLSAFLLRKSYLICGSYGYTLTLIKGVESFDAKRESPNRIIPNLTAKLECPMGQ